MFNRYPTILALQAKISSLDILFRFFPFMMFQVLHDDPSQSLLERLLYVRNINDHFDDFLHPTFQRYRAPRQLFEDAPKAAERIAVALKKHEKIMIFGDYDVDGIISSFIMYTFFRDYLWYTNISLRLPHRVHDGYGIKKHHIDDIVSTGTTVIITVDNGITAIEEAIYAKQHGIDLIVTDHHKPLETLPDTFALINPQCTDNYPLKEICWSVVWSKLCLAIATTLGRNNEQKQRWIHDMLPYMSIATIADCMPLIGENRLIVKKWLELMNTQRKNIHPALQTFLAFLNLKQIDTFHIAFLIAPRLNATGRISHALDGLKALLSKDKQKQRFYLEQMDDLNTERKKIQEQNMEIVQSMIEPNDPFLRAASPDLHEWVVGILAGKITEKYQKPSLILSINEQEHIATGSLRWPAWFNIVRMLQQADAYLLRYGGHAQAWGLTVHISQLPSIIEIFLDYCQTHACPPSSSWLIEIDTPLYDHELHRSTLKDVFTCGPYGEGNAEPTFLFENTVITQADRIGKNGGSHLKLHCKKWGYTFQTLQRGKGESIDSIQKHTPISLSWKVKEDTLFGGWYIEWQNLAYDT